MMYGVEFEGWETQPLEILVFIIKSNIVGPFH